MWRDESDGRQTMAGHARWSESQSIWAGRLKRRDRRPNPRTPRRKPAGAGIDGPELVPVLLTQGSRDAGLGLECFDRKAQS